MVCNLINANGNATANQFVINDFENGKVIFQSYSSKVCEIDFQNHKIVLGYDWDYSRTTMKHLAEFLRQNGLGCMDNAKAVRKAIKDGKHNDFIVEYDENMQ